LDWSADGEGQVLRDFGNNNNNNNNIQIKFTFYKLAIFENKVLKVRKRE